MVHYMFRGHGHRYMTDHFHILHLVYGILFLKQSEMLASYQLLNNLLNYAFKVYRSLTYILNKRVIGASPCMHLWIQLIGHENAVWTLVSATYLLSIRVSNYAVTSTVQERHSFMFCSILHRYMHAIFIVLHQAYQTVGF